MKQNTNGSWATIDRNGPTEQSAGDPVELWVADDEKDERRVKGVLPLDEVALLGASTATATVKFALETHAHLYLILKKTIYLIT